MAYIIQNRIKYGGSVPQVAVQDTPPTNPNIEVWYDTSEDAVAEAKDIKYDNSISGSDKITVQAELDNLNTGDRIIERGTSGVWTYEKWASGKAECWCNKTITNDSMTNLTTNIGYTSAAARPSIAFPFAFASVQDRQLNILYNDPLFIRGHISQSALSMTETGSYFFSSYASITVNTIQICIKIIGKWK